MGLDAPVYVQYFRWIWNILRGELGYSLVSGAPIVNMLRTRLPATMELALCGILISSVLAFASAFWLQSSRTRCWTTAVQR